MNNDFSASSRITILKGQNDDWRPVRQIMNQSSYFAANINDNGSLPPPPFANPFATAATNLFGGAQPRGRTGGRSPVAIPNQFHLYRQCGRADVEHGDGDPGPGPE